MYRAQNRFPEAVQQQLEESEVRLYDREVKLTIGLLHEAERCTERRWFQGALALTGTHLIAYAKQMELFHISLQEIRDRHLKFNADNPACLSVTTPRQQGQPAMEVRFYTAQAERYRSLLEG
ncbi:MAG: hypothetical protein OIF57_09685 [Marinobacterium sp.]|nr:hypothetical protein [Marinobacterium sp.]